MLNKKAVKYTFYLNPEELSNYLMENLDDNELIFLLDIHTSNIPHMESVKENSTINYLYTDIDDIMRINHILDINNIKFKFEDITELVFTDSPLIPMVFRLLMIMYMKKYFSIDDMLDKISKYGINDVDKIILEQLTQ